MQKGAYADGKTAESAHAENKDKSENVTLKVLSFYGLKKVNIITYPFDIDLSSNNLIIP